MIVGVRDCLDVLVESRPKRSFILLTILALVPMSVPLAAQDRFPPESDLAGAHYEGVRTQVNISAGQLRLLAFMAGEGPSEADADQFTISFFIPKDVADTLDLEVFVEDRQERLYYMIPVRKRWDPGLNTFEWDGEKARASALTPADLWGVAGGPSSGPDQLIFPVSIGGAASEPDAASYTLAFVANVAVTLRWTVFDALETEILSDVIQNQPANLDMAISLWSDGWMEGYYDLLVEYVRRDGTALRDQRVYRFYHRPQTVSPV